MLADLRYAARSLWNTPAFTALALGSLTIGLGVGATVLAFAIEAPALSADARVRRPVLALLGVAALLLVSACANVSTLLLSRGDARRRELAIRRAVGARRGHLVVQLLTETLLLAVGGGTSGLLAAAWSIDAIVATTTVPPLWATRAAVDAPIILTTVVATLLAAAGSGLLPALEATRPPAHDVLRDDDPAAPVSQPVPRGGALLVVAEVSLAALLGVVALTAALDPSAGMAVRAATGDPSLMTGLIAVCAGAALALAGIGIYAVTTYDLGRRAPEIGVRIALGATPRDLTRRAIARGMRTVLVGLGAGLAAAFLWNRALSARPGAQAAVATFVAVLLLVTSVGLLATSLPARRAARGSPARRPARSA